MNKTDVSKLITDFNCPGNKYRSAPFWAWNGKLEPDELRRQIRLMHEMGMGGFFMHSRVGLNTPYLSDEWFECVSACINEAEKLDMQAWLYDEDRWPSGAAGGLVTIDPQYRARKVVLSELDANGVAKFKPSGETLAIFAGKIDGHQVQGLRRLKSIKSHLQEGESILYFQVEIEECSSWYNGQTYLDTMSHKAVQRFIEVTHEEYRKQIGDKFGKQVPGIFTDEPNYGRICQKMTENRWSNPWTAKLPEFFNSRYGYDLIPHLPELFYDIEGVKMSQARLNYFDSITSLFVDAFSHQIGDWCAKNNIQLTGHVLEEDSLRRQTNCIGSAMRFYEYMQAPGIDLLTEHWRIYDTVKQMTSVARQFDRQWRLTETYGCTGWDFPLSGHKALGDWQAALGINLRCQHLAWYTMAAEAKRDYPASISYQSPWFRNYRQVEDYFARINLIMSNGKEIRDLLVLHPIESAWTLARKNWLDDQNTINYDKKFMRLGDVLLKAGLDFDYGDEEMMSRHARIIREEGQPRLHLAKAPYKAVVVPEMLTIRSSTLRFLKDFVAIGGMVVFVGKIAAFVDGAESNEASILADSCLRVKKEGTELVAMVEKLVRRIKIVDADGNNVESALYQFRQENQADSLFVCNTGHQNNQLNNAHEFEDSTLSRNRQRKYPQITIFVKTDKKGTVLELDPENGNIYLARAKKTLDGWLIATSLEAIGSRLFIISIFETEEYPLRPQFKMVRKKTLNPVAWNIRLSEDNVVVFDHFQTKINDRQSTPSEYVLALDDRLRKLIGGEPRGGAMVQPWIKQRDSGKTIHLLLTMYFYCKTIPSGAVYLAMEFPSLYQITVNGHKILLESECGWWCDHSMRKLPVDTSMLCLGNNVITLECNYNGRHPGLEMVYLLGDFGTKVKGNITTLTAPLKQLKIGDWCKQGLNFYSGAVIYSVPVKVALYDGERLFITLPEYRGTCIRILVDSKLVGIIAWPPQELDITDYAQNGKFELSIEVVSSRRNSHGPFHCKEKWPIGTGPYSYKEYTKSDYQLVPCGLLKKPVLEVRKEV